MTEKKMDKVRRILLSGGAACDLTGIITQDLYNMQLLIRLKKCGFIFAGSCVWICRIVCDPLLEDKIKKMAEKKKGVLIIGSADAKEKVISRRFRKDQVISQKELFAATGSEELFFLIDLGCEHFEILNEKDACALIDDFWKKRQEGT